MNLQKVKPHDIPIIVYDALTGNQLYIGKTSAPVYADLDGEPFKAYYSEWSAQYLTGQITEEQFYGND